MVAKNVVSDYDGRIRRAERLATLHPFTQEVLAFYKQIAEFQKSLYARMISDGKVRAVDKNLPALRQNLKIEGLLPQFQDFWTTSSREDRPNAAFDQFLPRAFLQPYAEHLAAGRAEDETSAFPALCPSCGARPLLGVLRPEGDGGKRFLLCSFCLREWEFRRIFCATCGEETETKLPVYVAEQFPYIRVEACETCKFYLRTIDLTKDGNAVPLVDDLAAIPLSLWAEEHGYSRAQPNLLGT